MTYLSMQNLLLLPVELLIILHIRNRYVYGMIILYRSKDLEANCDSQDALEIPLGRQDL